MSGTRQRFGVIALALLAAFAWSVPIASGATKPVLAHYMPWYVAKPYSGAWGWHWTMSHFDPEVVNASGERQVASWYYPAIGPYDSADPAVLEYHVLLMKLAGVDGVIADWYGMDNYLDYGPINQRTTALLETTRRAGLIFALCYEDRTIQVEINGGFLASSNALAHAQQTMRYAETNYFNASHYLRRNNRPVLLNFGPQYFKNDAQWQQIFSVLDLTNRPQFFTEDNRLASGAGAFNWPPMYLSQSTGGVLTGVALEAYLADFEQKGPSWPAFISAAFPRFHDIYAEAGVGPSYGSLSDNAGETLRSTLTRAMTNASAMVQLVTWNDFGEGTIVEPTGNFGYRDLGIIQDLRRHYLEPGFAHHTNDLHLATRFYQLRRQFAGNALLAAELDRVFSNIVSGDLSGAQSQLDGLENGRPVLYNISCAAETLQFAVGGDVSVGVQVETAPDLEGSSWAVVGTFPPSTNRFLFSMPTSGLRASAFFRARAGL